MTDQPTRGEFDLLKQMVMSGQTHVENLDAQGTRGVGIVQAQLVEVVKDLTELKADVNARFDAHMKVHEQDLRDRAAGRRWLISTLIATVVMLAAILALAVDIAGHPRR